MVSGHFDFGYKDYRKDKSYRRFWWRNFRRDIKIYGIVWSALLVIFINFMIGTVMAIKWTSEYLLGMFK